MKLISLLTINIIVMTINVSPGHYLDFREYYISPQQLKEYCELNKFIRWDKIPIEFNEESVLIGRCLVKNMLIVIPVKYDAVKESFEKSLKEEYGLSKTNYYVREFPFILNREEKIQFLNRIMKLQLGIKPGKYQKVNFVSDRYNKLGKSIFGKPKYYSELKIKIADFTNIFNIKQEICLVYITRQDTWPDWGGLPGAAGSGAKLPWKTLTRGNILTKNEIEFTEGVIGSLKPDYILVYPNDYIVSLSFIEFLTQLKTDLDGKMHRSTH